jgi:hypothetical protein
LTGGVDDALYGGTDNENRGCFDVSANWLSLDVRQALEKVARYDGGYTKTSPTIIMFWEVRAQSACFVLTIAHEDICGCIAVACTSLHCALIYLEKHLFSFPVFYYVENTSSAICLLLDNLPI